VGDLISGLLSQFLRSRRKVVFSYLMGTILISLMFLFGKGFSSTFFYLLCFFIGCGAGYWALFVTMASESFGTNIRATVTTTVPNFVRGAVVPITLSFKALEVHIGNINSALVIGAVCLTLALAAVWYLPETFAKDLNYQEN